MVRHRLRRYEQVTNCNLRNIATLAELWWALEGTAMKPGADIDAGSAIRDPSDLPQPGARKTPIAGHDHA